jgi:hypothetical protein
VNSSAPTAEAIPAEPRLCWIVLEVVLILLVFFLYAGGPPPDVNEAHYLAKAKHYWDPSWCPDDRFLDSADAHLVFNWTFGWLTLYFSLPIVAWIGRGLTWTLLAWAWRRLSYALVPWPVASVLSASLMILFSQRCHMAGEWIVGGVEAKGFAFVLVILGMEAIVRNRWRRVWLLLGAAASFHVLVGGWSVIAAGLALLVQRKDRPPLLPLVPWLAGGFLLALPGLAPAVALTWDIDPDIVRQANVIYVFRRLSHHLVLHKLPAFYIVRHIGLALVWCALVYALRREQAQRRLHAFVAGAVLIALTGAIVDFATRGDPAMAARLLRYYWFRLSDAVLPMGVALASIGAIQFINRRRPAVAQWCLVVAASIAAFNLAATMLVRRHDPRPRADLQTLPGNPLDAGRTRANFHQWLRACHWIATHTEPDDRFLTPRWQQTFKWYAGRSEVVNWKDVPQDAKTLVEWWARYREVYPYEVVQQGLASHGEQHIIELARKHDAQYILIDRHHSQRRLGLPRVYPTPWQPDATYEIYRIPER